MRKISYVVTLAAVLVFAGTQIASSQTSMTQSGPVSQPYPPTAAPCPIKPMPLPVTQPCPTTVPSQAPCTTPCPTSTPCPSPCPTTVNPCPVPAAPCSCKPACKSKTTCKCKKHFWQKSNECPTQCQ